MYGQMDACIRLAAYPLEVRIRQCKCETAPCSNKTGTRQGSVEKWINKS